MNLVIETKTEEPLLDRVRVTALVTVDATLPTLEAIRVELATHLKIEETLIAVEHVFPLFGGGSARIISCAYKSTEAMNFFKKKVKKVPAQPTVRGKT